MSKDGLKIVTIGGGSSYTPELIEGYILRQEQLPISEIVLVDIDEGREKLEIVGAMAKRMVKAADLDWKVTLTYDRFEALKDADYVTTQFRVGLLNARVKDERIPLSHGVLGQETNGAGGLFKAFRTIPVILDIIEDMKVQCPNAWLINFTNPAGMVTEAAINIGGWERTLGLCNVPIGHTKAGAEALGMDEEELFFHYAGINHFHWHRIFDKDGNERTHEVIDKIYDPSGVGNKGDMENIHAGLFHYEQIKDLNMLPCGYHRYYYLADEMLEESIKDFNEGKTRAQVVKGTEADLFELYKDPELDYKPEELTLRGGTHYSDAACEIIASIQNNKHTQMVVSTKNNGTITDLPNSAVVEVSGVVTAKGFVPYNWGAFEHPAARGSLQLMKAMEETTIRAAVSGDYGVALQAFTMNPLIPAGHKAKTLLDQMLYANKKYLPQFAEKIKEIEKYQLDDINYIDKLMESN